jgi:hypothetical protein
MKATFKLSKVLYYAEETVELSEWDEKKIREYAAKNAVSFEEAFSMLANQLEATFDVGYDYNWDNCDYLVEEVKINTEA